MQSPLYSYLISDDVPFVCFAQDRKQLGILSKMTSHQGSFVFSANKFSQEPVADRITYINTLNWSVNEPWTTKALEELKKLKFKRASFLFSIELIPIQLIEELEKFGCTEFIYIEANQWRRVDTSQSKVGFGFWLNRFRSLRKVFLNLLGKRLDLEHCKIFRDGGYCYKVRLPKDTTQGTSLKNLHSDLLLFEDDIRLDQSSARISDIVSYGKGRFCQQGLELFFSSSDNSHPRSNNKTYRFVDLKGPLKKLGRFFYPLSERLLDISAPPIDFETEVHELIAQRYKLGLKAIRNESNGHDPVCLFSSNLGPGGTERQMTYFAKHLSNNGKDVHIFTCGPLSEMALHYYPTLPLSNSIKIQPITQPNLQFQEEGLFAETWGHKTLTLFQVMPEYMRDSVWNLYTHLMVIKPQVLHCWLDYPNVIGAMAGWLAGVPQIILSTRNLNPTHFPHFYCSWYQFWYQALSQLPNVKLIGNSQAGIDDYSRWLNIPSSRFSLVKNGVDRSIIKLSDAEETNALRQSLNIEQDAPLIGGIFRLDPEKRPFTFLQVVLKIKEKLPRLKVLIAGVGTLEEAVRTKVKDLNADSWINVLGRRQDVPLIISACDIILLTSSGEGTPNALMEAQCLGKPVVATNVGGVAEIVEDGKTGYLKDKDDIDGLVEACCSLLANADLRQNLGKAGNRLVEEYFSVEKMVNDTLVFYDDHALVKS